MKVAKKIENRIERFQEGSIFGYQQLDVEHTEYRAATKALERMVRKGLVKRASTGVFYKPKQSAFGELRPTESELLKPYLFKNGKRIAYVSGTALYNKMGLTTQVPNTIQIASMRKRVATKIGNTQVKPVKSYVAVTNENYVFLEVLDALKDFKSISDLDKYTALAILKSRIDSLSEKKMLILIKLALSYPPRVVALLGAILEQSTNSLNLTRLKNNLNPLSVYNLGIPQHILPTRSNWNIV